MDDGKLTPLVVSFLKIGLFGFGGGYAMLPLISHELVDLRGWMATGEFADVVALSQMLPGAVVLNAATYVGLAQSGLVAAVLAVLAVCLPPFVIMLLVCRFFLSFKEHPRVQGALALLRPAVVGLILVAALTLMTKESFSEWTSWPIFAAVFAVTTVFRVHPIPTLIGAGLAGWLLH